MFSSISGFLLFSVWVGTSSANGHHGHGHHVPQNLPDQWYHENSHPVNDLFKRGPSGLQVGTPAWSAQFPAATPDVTQLPEAWVHALNNAIAAKKIPDIPISSSPNPYDSPTYPAGADPGGPLICSATAKCRNTELGDIWDAPDNFFGTGFDDGPQPVTPRLLQFLAANNDHATHFMIGVNILANPNEFTATFAAGEDLAVHTWTHPHMTALSNLDVVAQLGWTMEIIFQSTNGRVPKFWRPPFGDSDNRVRAIAQEVFGLKTIMWNQDTNDWKIASGLQTSAGVNASFTGWLTGPKTPGLIVLEHETSDQSVQSFMDAYPNIKSLGWQMRPVTQLVNTGGSSGPYRDAGPADILFAGANTTLAVATTSTTSSTISTISTTALITAGGTTGSAPLVSASTTASPVSNGTTAGQGSGNGSASLNTRASALAMYLLAIASVIVFIA